MTAATQREDSHNRLIRYLLAACIARQLAADNGRLDRVQKEGKLHSGDVRYGYRYKDGVPVIDRSEAKIARIIFEMGLETTAFHISQYLNAEGYRTRKGKPWRRETVSHILQKAPLYAGWYVYRHGITIAKREYQERIAIVGDDDAAPLDISNVIVIKKYIYPPLITEQTARRIQAQLEWNKEHLSGRPSRQRGSNP